MAGASPVQTQEDLVPPKPAAIGYRWAGVLLAPAVAVAVHLILTGPFALDLVTPSGADLSDLESLELLTTLLFALGVALLAWLTVELLVRSLGDRGRRIWIALAVAVTIISLVPVLLLDAPAGVKWGLAALHLSVAVVLIPTMASRTPAEPLRRGDAPPPSVALHDDPDHQGDHHDAPPHGDPHADVQGGDAQHDQDPYATDPHEVADPSH